MPRVIETVSQDSIELGDLIERLETEPFDPCDEECFASWGEMLKKLGNNRRFLGDLVVAELSQASKGGLPANHYSAQVIVLHSGRKSYLLRANFWPAEHDSIVVNSGMAPFFYGLPHDHNFSFLTVGYLGPGYWSEYYEYDYETVVGHVGEKVDLRFVERSRLEPGKVMLYRAHRDVHSQLPADEMSVSLNILGRPSSQAFRDQYRFDAERGEVAGIINDTSLEPLLALAAHFGGDNGRSLLEDFAGGHPSDRIRFAAVRAQAAAAGDVAGRIEVYRKASALPNRFVSAMARREAKIAERGRAWLDASPQTRDEPGRVGIRPGTDRP